MSSPDGAMVLAVKTREKWVVERNIGIFWAKKMEEL